MENPKPVKLKWPIDHLVYHRWPYGTYLLKIIDSYKYIILRPNINVEYLKKILKHHISIQKLVASDIANKALVIFYKLQNKSPIC